MDQYKTSSKLSLNPHSPYSCQDRKRPSPFSMERALHGKRALQRLMWSLTACVFLSLQAHESNISMCRKLVLKYLRCFFNMFLRITQPVVHDDGINLFTSSPGYS